MESKTRRIAYKEALRLDYVFDGMENCLIEVMNGNDAVIYYDRSLSDMVIGKVVKVSGFGLKIPFEVRGGL